GALEVRLHAGEVAPAVVVLLTDDPGEAVLDRRVGGGVVAEDAGHDHGRAHAVHRVVDVLLVPRAVARLPLAETRETSAAGIPDPGDFLSEEQLGDERVLDEMCRDLHAGRVEVVVVPAAVRVLVLDDEPEPAPPRALDVGAAMALVEGEDDVEEAD